MKKFLLSSVFSFAVLLSFAQYPCVSGFKINNGGGNTTNCPAAEPGYVVTGKVTLQFESQVSANDLPKILSAYDVTNGVSVLGVKFGPGEIVSNTAQKVEVAYCYYSGPNNANNLLGANTQYTFAVSYQNGTVSCGGEPIPLPVTFKSFKADRKSSSSVGMTWTTASEQNNKGFFVQRNDGAGWKNVAFVFSAANGGNSSSDLSYSFNDVNTETAISQYRIQQVDLDGMARYSTISAVRGLTSTTKLLVYPNPSSNGIVNVVFDQDGTQDVQVSDAAGRSIRQFKSVTNNILVIENLKSGFYTLKITNRNTAKTITQKVVVK